jgi:hypothetical protein
VIVLEVPGVRIDAVAGSIDAPVAEDPPHRALTGIRAQDATDLAALAI